MKQRYLTALELDPKDAFFLGTCAALRNTKMAQSAKILAARAASRGG